MLREFLRNLALSLSPSPERAAQQLCYGKMATTTATPPQHHRVSAAASNSKSPSPSS